MTEKDKLSMDLYWLLTEVFLLLDDIDRRTLKGYNLSVPQYNALYHLADDAGLNINELSEKLICDKSNTTRLVERLKHEGLVTRERNENDRRYVSVRLTDRGEKLREGAVAKHQASIHQRINVLDSQDQSALLQLLMQLRNGLHTQLAELQSTTE